VNRASAQLALARSMTVPLVEWRGTRERRLHVLFYNEAIERGGAETSVGNLVGALDPSIEVTIMGPTPEIVDWMVKRRSGARGVVLPRVRSRYDLLAMRAHRRAVSQLRPDIFQAGLANIWGCAYALLAANTVRGVATVAVEHTPFEGDANHATRWLKRRVASGLDAHVAVSRHLARHVERRASLRDHSIRVIHNGVPDEAFARVARVSEGLIVGVVARLDAMKGVDVLLRALADLPGVTAVIVGDGPETAPLRALAHELGVADRAHFVGWSDQVRSWLAAMDVFVLPSLMEGFPLSICEAMLAGLPVVATDVGGTRELVTDGVTGLVVQPSDPGALAVALRSLQADPALRHLLGDAGRDHASRTLTSARMAEEYEALYCEIGRS
jgi:glycosyltransferase involved in cell wall biosynthesis